MTGLINRYQQLLRLCFFTIVTLLLTNSIYGQTAAFTIDNASGCAPLSVNFTDASTGGTVVSRVWNLGSGPISNTDPTVGANFNTPGTYTISLTVNFSNGTSQTQQHTVTVHPKPVADFDASTLIGCANLPVNFTDASTTSTGTITRWNWSFGASSSVAQNPSYSFNSNGQYTVSLFVENNWGCRSDAETRPNYITVHPRPNAAFTIDAIASCTLPFSPTITNTSTGSGTLSYEWNLGNGETSTDANPTANYTSSGVYNISMTASNGTNCNSTASSRTVYVGKPAVPPVLTGPANICAGASGNFSYPAVNPSNWVQSTHWDFGNGVTQNGGSSINYTYPTHGTYTVTATIQYRSGCEDVITTSVTVSPTLSVAVSATPSTACRLPFVTTFTANVTPANPNYVYSWNFGDGSPLQTGVGLSTPNHSYGTAGNYTASVTVTDPDNPNTTCNSRTATTLVRAAIPTINIYSYTPQSGCKPLLTIFNSYLNIITPITGVQYTWDFGDGSTPYVHSPNSNYSSAQHLYTNAGTFTVRVTALTPEGCTTYDEVQVTVTDDCPPGGGNGGGGGGFGNNGGTCANRLAYTFNANTIPGTTVHSWNFGDPASGATNEVMGNNASITHEFSNPATYTVTLTREVTLTGQLITTTQSITVSNNPIVPAFTANPVAVCPDGVITFTPTGINPDQVRSYSWDFGDGSPIITVTNTNPPATPIDGVITHPYTETGTYTVTLTIVDRLGCTIVSDNSVKITVAGPVADFSAVNRTSCEENFDVTFTPTQTPIDPSVPIRQWIWNFGDGTIITRNNSNPVTHSYTNNQPYTAYNVSLTIEDVNECRSNVVLKPSYVKSYRPRASFYANSQIRCNDKTVIFYNNSAAQGIPASPNYKFVWNFGDGSPLVSTNDASAQSHTYVNDGDYTVTLIVMDENGCTNTYIQNNYIRIVKPVADFAPDGSITECAPISLGFTNLSQTFGQPATYTWDFGNSGTGSTSEIPQPVIYPVPNDYNVTLTVNSLGCISTVTKPITVKGPRGNLIADVLPGCKPYTLNMQVTGTNISNYAWDYNDGTPVTPSPSNHTVSHIYNLAGIYNPNVILRSPEGCSFTLRPSQPIIVDSVKAKFTADIIKFCDAGTVNFSNQSAVPAFSSFTSQQWNFGDGTTYNGANPPPHQYNTPGSYAVTLQTTSQYGCTDLAQTSVQVNASPTAQINGAAINCLQPGSTLQYNASVTSVEPITTYVWQINGVTMGQNSPAFVVNYRQPGTHELALTVTTSNDCSFTVTRSIIIDSVVANFNVDDNFHCATGEVLFTNNSTSAFPISSFVWNYDNGITPTLPVTGGSYTYPLPGEYFPSLLLQTANGCSNSYTLPQMIKVYTAPIVTITGEEEKCAQNELRFTSNIQSEDAVVSTVWRLNNTIISNTTEAAYRFTRAGDYVLTFTVTTQHNCVVVVTKNITIHPLPVPNASPKTATICEQTTIQLLANDGTKYTWTPAEGIISGANTATPVVSPANTTKYYVTVTNQFECVQTDSVIITVDKRVRLTHSDNKVICIGQSVQLQAAGNTNQFVWSPATGLNNAAIGNPIATPTQTTTYSVTGVSQNVCPNETGHVLVVVGNYPTVDLGNDIVITAGQQHTFNPIVSADVEKYVWQPITGLSCTTCARPNFVADQDITYSLTVTNQYNCSTTDEVNVKVLCNKGTIYVPNAFTPNGDGKNDIFYIGKSFGVQEIKSFNIFNRWGQLVFSRKNIQANEPGSGWDGRVKGQMVETTTVFVYTIEAICNEGLPVVIKGTVTLVK